MHKIKKEYQKPVMTDQGPVVTRTRATANGDCWDGNPNDGKDNQKPCTLGD